MRMRMRPRPRSRPRPDPKPPSAESGTKRVDQHRRAQVAVLADIAARAATLQPAAEDAVAACGCPGVVPDIVAVEVGRYLRAYSKLYETARYLPVEPELLDTREELTRLLSYHLHMLRDAGDLAFSGLRDPRTEPFRRELAEGFSVYASRLLVLAGVLQKRLQNFGEPEPEPGDRLMPGEIELDDVELSDDRPESKH